MAGNNTRFFFALLIGLSVGFLAGFLTATQLEPSETRIVDSTAMGSSQPSSAEASLPDGHPPIDFSKEIEALEQILQRDPEDFAALAQMGNIYYDMGRFNDAIPYYKKALMVNPDDFNVRTDMGTCYHYSGQHERAIQEFESVLQKNPNFAAAWYNIGIVKYSGLGDSKGAMEAWEKLLATNPDYPGADRVRQNIDKLKAGQSL